MIIKTCPFCGARADIYFKDRIFNARKDVDGFTITQHRITWVADCSECDCVVGEEFPTRSAATNAWNTRAIPFTPEEMANKIEEAISDRMPKDYIIKIEHI